MISPIEKKQINYIGFETDSKTKSSSIKDEKEIKISNISNKVKNKIKRIKTSSPPINYENSQIQSTKNIDKNICKEDNAIKEKKYKDKNIKPLFNSDDLNYIQKNYNLEEAYRMNNVIEKLQKGVDIQSSQKVRNYNNYEYINLKNKKNNITYVNSIKNINNKCNNTNKGEYKYDEEQIYEDDYKKYTSSYRDKMVKKLKEKLNRDNIVDDSLSELKSEKQSITYIDDKIGKVNKDCLTKSNKKNKLKKIKINKSNVNDNSNLDYSIFKKINKIKKNNNKFLNKNSSIEKLKIDNRIKNNKKNETNDNKLSENKSKGMKNLIGFNQTENNLTFHNNHTYLLIKDLLNSLNNKKKDSSLPKKKFLNNNNNMTIKSTAPLSTRKQNNNNIRNKNEENNNIFSNDNKTSNCEYLTKKITKFNTQKKRDNLNMNKKSRLYIQKMADKIKKRVCVIRSIDIKNMTCKNIENISLNHILNKNKLIKTPKSFFKIKNESKDKKNNKNSNLIYNIKNHIKSDENKNLFNRTLTKSNKKKLFFTSILRKNKNKKDLLNITSNSNNKSLYMKNTNKSNNILKYKKTQILYCNIFKNQRKIEIKILTPIISTYIDEDKGNISYREKTMTKSNNNNNDVNLSSIIKNYNKNIYNKKKKYDRLNNNDFYNNININKNKKNINDKISKIVNKNEKDKIYYTTPKSYNKAKIKYLFENK